MSKSYGLPLKIFCLSPWDSKDITNRLGLISITEKYFEVFHTFAIVYLSTYLLTLLSTNNLPTILSFPFRSSTSSNCSLTKTSSSSTSVKVRFFQRSSSFSITLDPKKLEKNLTFAQSYKVQRKASPQLSPVRIS